jgi:hypothetical protein
MRDVTPRSRGEDDDGAGRASARPKPGTRPAPKYAAPPRGGMGMGIPMNDQTRAVFEANKQMLGIESDRGLARHAFGSQTFLLEAVMAGKRLFLADENGKIEAELDIFPPKGWED